MLVGKQADVYFTGEMSHVGPLACALVAPMLTLSRPTARGLGCSRGWNARCSMSALI
jgi:hypothetical protein